MGLLAPLEATKEVGSKLSTLVRGTLFSGPEERIQVPAIDTAWSGNSKEAGQCRSDVDGGNTVHAPGGSHSGEEEYDRYVGVVAVWGTV